jgi:hypothetical protein
LKETQAAPILLQALGGSPRVSGIFHVRHRVE